MGNCPDGEIGLVRSCPCEDLSCIKLSWWGVVLVGSHPGGQLFWRGLSWWRVVLAGRCPGGESSEWVFSSGELS